MKATNNLLLDELSFKLHETCSTERTDLYQESKD